MFIYFCIIILIFFTACDKPSLHIAEHKYKSLRLEAPQSLKDSQSLKGLTEVIKVQIDYFNRLVLNQRETKYISLAYARNQLECFRLFYEGLQSASSEEDFYRFVEENFDFYKSRGIDGKVFFTGYYSPIINGSLRESETFSYPLYPIPDDRITINLRHFRIGINKILYGRIQDTQIVPYYTRREIDEKLGFNHNPLIYVQDPVEAFILHVQGSGFVRLEDGSLFPVHYAGTNGHRYVSIGKLLIEDKKIPPSRMSMQAIKDYFHDHPHDIKSYLYKNPSYVFFKKGDDHGSRGSLGLPIKGGRSIAADREVFPKGALSYVITERPVSINEKGEVVREQFSAFVIDQDSGGAIKGPGRVDIYWGEGKEAGFMAGYMKSYGAIYYLQKKHMKRKS